MTIGQDFHHPHGDTEEGENMRIKELLLNPRRFVDFGPRVEERYLDRITVYPKHEFVPSFWHFVPAGLIDKLTYEQFVAYALTINEPYPLVNTEDFRQFLYNRYSEYSEEKKNGSK